MASLLDGFLETCADEDASAPPQTWEGSKSDFSIYDAVEILGGQKLPPPGKQNLLGGGQGVAVPSATVQMPVDPQRGRLAAMSRSLAVFRGMRAEACEPRALKAMRQSCCVYHLDQDTSDDCPVCLERMLSGQTAWRLPCLHQVHHSCASRYFGARGVKPLCPLCRCDVAGPISRG
jgi:hypothetical protein